jgi:hypothetical protein
MFLVITCGDNYENFWKYLQNSVNEKISKYPRGSVNLVQPTWTKKIAPVLFIH